MLRLACGALALWLTLACGPVAAQQAAAPPAETGGAEAVSRADIDRLVRILRDDAARERLIRALGTADAAPGARPAGEAEPDRPLTRFLVALGETVTGIGAGLSDAGAFLGDLPLLLRWFEVRFGTPERRGELFWSIVRVLAILGAGIVVQRGVGHLLAGWRGRLAARPIERRSRRFALAAAHAAIGLLPLAAFWLAALATLAFARPDRPVTLFAVAIINAHVLGGILILVPWMVLAPRAPTLRLLPLDDAMAARLYSVTRAVIQVATYGSFGALALASSMPSWVYNLVVKFVGVAVAVLLAVLVLRSREAIRGLNGRATPLDRYLRRRVVDVWHVLALAFLALSVSVWLARGGDGILYLGRALVLSGIALGLATAVLAGFRWAVGQLLAMLGRYAERDFSFAARLQIYVGALSWIAMAAVTAVTLVAVAEAWAVPLLEWFEKVGARRLVASLVSIGVIVAVGVAIWEALNLMAERLIRVEDRGLGGMRRQARLRTLLPLIRRATLGMLVLFLGLIGLSELGINIGPLLAGAGVVGIAIGFGAQQVVKDIFGGISVLIEDSIVVGDIVEVAGKGGVVEWMSMRAIRLRDFDGTVHTVPFGDITTVSNRSRNFAFAVLRIGVAYDSDVAVVQDAIRATVARLREDPEYAAMILDDVELHGIESFGDFAMVALARIKVAPAKQWAVTRQFHVLLKQEFDRRGIEIPFPQRTITVRDGRPVRAADGAEDFPARRKPARA
ncbi:MAG: mechanosensitive ion channel [Alphaproteobacteria bacterium]|nr:mechanosensitive ion channel [Alphaproteobacteria bacterium]